MVSWAMRLRRRFVTLASTIGLVLQLSTVGIVAGADDPVLVGAGDIGDCTSTRDEATADLLDDIPGTVVTLGDNVYQSGTAAEFDTCYDPGWGRHRTRTHPSTGNHDYKTPGAAGYFGYFGSAAGDRDTGYYSYDRGAWHIVVLNSNCEEIGGCGAASDQVAWLKADLAAHAGSHVLAYWHHPRYSSGKHGSDPTVQAFWNVLYAAGADLVLNGHDHDYERFAPQDPWGRADPTHGIRQFVVGTGGTNLRARATVVANSEVFATAHGVLKLTLRSDSYDWAFVPVAGVTFSDTGSDEPHGPPPPRTRTVFRATADAWVDQAHRHRNRGKTGKLLVDGDTGRGFKAHTYIKVKVGGTSGVVHRAVLRVWVTGATRDGPTIARTTTTWSESTITWANRPGARGGVITDAGAIPVGAWYEFDVTSHVTGDGSYGFVLRPTSRDGIDMSSRQGTRPPRLVVETIPGAP